MEFIHQQQYMPVNDSPSLTVWISQWTGYIRLLLDTFDFSWLRRRCGYWESAQQASATCLDYSEWELWYSRSLWESSIKSTRTCLCFYAAEVLRLLFNLRTFFLIRLVTTTSRITGPKKGHLTIALRRLCLASEKSPSLFPLEQMPLLLLWAAHPGSLHCKCGGIYLNGCWTTINTGKER